MTIAGRWRPLHFLAVLAITSITSCTSSSSPSVRVSNLLVAVTPNPIVQAGIGACVNPRTGVVTPGTYRLFPHAITLEETGGVGMAVESWQLFVLAGGQEVPVTNFGPVPMEERFSDCGGTGNRIEPFQRRCNQQALFCAPINTPVPQQLRARFTATDDTGQSITREGTVNLEIP